MTLPVCPDPDLLAACAEGRLRGDERERVLRHLTTCHDCYAVFTEALRFLDEAPATEAATADGHVPAAASGEERVLPARPAPVPPATPAPPPSPGDKLREPRANVVPFDRRRWRRVATVALPLAAAAALAVVMIQRRPSLIGTPPVTLAQAPPSPVATPPAAPRPPVRAARVVERGNWMWTPSQRLPGLGPETPDRICRFTGVAGVDLEVAAQANPPAIRERLDTAVTALQEMRAADALVEPYERLASELEHGRRADLAQVTPGAAACRSDAVQAGRALEWLRLASLSRDRDALEHPDVIAGLAAARRNGSPAERRELDALLLRWPPAGADERAWSRLAEPLARTWKAWLP